MTLSLSSKKKLSLISSDIPDDIILKSLILIDFFDKKEDVFSRWNYLLVSRTHNAIFVEPHIHIFTDSNINIESNEIKQHLIPKCDLLIEMINIMLICKELGCEKIVIVTSNELLIHQMTKLNEHFKIIFVKNSSQVSQRINN
jgi:hypothetical protein